MNLKLLGEAIVALEEQRVKIDMAIAGLRRVIALYVDEKPEPTLESEGRRLFGGQKIVEPMTPETAPLLRRDPTPPVEQPRVRLRQESDPPDELRDARLDNGELLAWRHRHGLGQIEAGRILGCTASNVCRIEQGNRKVSPEYRAAMERYDKEHPAKAPAAQRQPGPRFPAVP